MTKEIELYQKHNFTLIRVAFKGKIPLDKDWPNTKPVRRSVEHYRNCNVGVLCGTDMVGGFLVVIDIDPRNGGLESLALLEKEFGRLPPTLTVKTGTDGLHLYYKYKDKIPKTVLLPGIDIQGVGSFVVGAGSIHENGKRYVVERDHFVNLLPEKIARRIFERKNQASVSPKPAAGYYDSETTPDSVTTVGKIEADKAIVPKGERDHWLTRKAGQLRYTGLAEEQIYNQLVIFNRNCDPPKGDSDLRRIARSVARYAPSDQDLIMAKPKAKVEVKESQPKITVKSGGEYQDELKAAYQMTTGLVRGIADHILKGAKRPYDHFAMASAFGVLAGVAQGVLQCPSLDDKSTAGGSPSLYQYLTSPPASGKNAYIRAVDSYLYRTDKRLVAAKFGSSYGLRGSFFIFNSVTSVIDEMQDEMKRLTSNHHMAEVLTDIKELFNDLPYIKSTIVKASCYPEIQLPRYSIFATGISGAFKSQLNSEIIGGGFLSRFLVWPEFDVPDLRDGAEAPQPLQDHLAQLLTIMQMGMTEAGAKQTHEEQLEILASMGERNVKRSKKEDDKIIHIPQTDPFNMVMTITDAAKAMFRDYRSSADKTYRSLVKTGEASDDISPASIVARSPQQAMKLATCHAIGRDSGTIEPLDAEIGLRIAQTLYKAMAALIRSGAARDGYEAKMKRLTGIIGRYEQAVPRRVILQFAHMPSKEVNDMLVDMTIGENLVAYGADGKPVDLEGIKGIPRGVTFGLPRPE